MGKGDKKTKKGKIWLGSFGVSRSRKAIKEKMKRTSHIETQPKEVDEIVVPVKPKKKAKKVAKKKAKVSKPKKETN